MIKNCHVNYVTCMEYLSILEYDALNIDKQLVTEISEKLSPPPPFHGELREGWG